MILQLVITLISCIKNRNLSFSPGSFHILSFFILLLLIFSAVAKHPLLQSIRCCKASAGKYEHVSIRWQIWSISRGSRGSFMLVYVLTFYAFHILIGLIIYILIFYISLKDINILLCLLNTTVNMSSFNSDILIFFCFYKLMLCNKNR